MFAHIFWRNFVFTDFWSILEHEMTRPVIERQHEERRRPKPKGRTKAHVDSKPIHAHPSSKRAQRTEPTKMRSRYFGIKQSCNTLIQISAINNKINWFSMI